MKRLPLVGQQYTGFTLAAAASECTNLYQETMENAPDQAKNFGILRGIPGLTLFKDLTTINASATPVRGLWGGGGRLFVAAGTKEFEVSSAGALIGSVNTIANDATSTPAQIFADGTQLLIISAGQAYADNGAGPIACRFQVSGTCTTNGTAVTWVSGDVAAAGWVARTVTINGVNYTVNSVAGTPNWTLTGSAGVQAVPVAFNLDGGDLVTAVTGAFLDGYGLVQRPSGGTPDLGRQVNFSEINDFTVWRGLDFFTKEAYPDYIRSILADNEQLYLLGTETSEVWQTVASSAAFQRIPGMFIHRGSVARYAPVSMGGYIYWLEGGSLGQMIAYRSAGGAPERISTYAEEIAWAQAFAVGSGSSLVPNNPTGFAYEDNGHMFWVINFALGIVSGVNAFAFDATEKVWHQRGNYMPPISGDGTFTAYIPAFHTFIPEWGTKGTHIVGDSASGKLYTMSSDVFTDASANPGMSSFIGYRRAIPYRYNGGNQMFFGRQQLEMQTGTVPSGAAPNITRDYSDDRGATFTNPQDASLGTAGQVSKRVFWPCGGSSRGRVWRYLILGNFKVALIDLQGEEVEGTV